MQEHTIILIVILCIIFLIFFIAVLLCLRLILYKVGGNGEYHHANSSTWSAYHADRPLTKEQGETLFDLRDCREKLRSPFVVTRSRDGEILDNGRFNALQASPVN
jgi:hypothetical protein